MLRKKSKCKKLCKHTIHGHAPLLHLSEQHIKPLHSVFHYIVDVEWEADMLKQTTQMIRKGKSENKRLSEWNNPLNRHETINILDFKCFRPVDVAPPSLIGPCLALQMWGKHHSPPSLALLSSLSGAGMAVSVSSPAEHYWGRSSSPVCASEWVGGFKPACVCDGAGPDGLSGKSFGRSPRT